MCDLSQSLQNIILQLQSNDNSAWKQLNNVLNDSENAKMYSNQL